MFLLASGAATMWALVAVRHRGVGDVLFVLAVSLPVVLLVWGAQVEQRVVLHRDSATVVGFYSRRRVKKVDIAGIEIDRMLPWGYTIYLITEAGRVAVPAFQVRRFGIDSPSHRAMGAAADELRKWLAEGEVT